MVTFFTKYLVLYDHAHWNLVIRRPPFSPVSLASTDCDKVGEIIFLQKSYIIRPLYF